MTEVIWCATIIVVAFSIGRYIFPKAKPARVPQVTWVFSFEEEWFVMPVKIMAHKNMLVIYEDDKEKELSFVNLPEWELIIKRAINKNKAVKIVFTRCQYDEGRTVKHIEKIEEKCCIDSRSAA